MEATLTLHQAGDRLGVADTDLNRLIRIGALPEARKTDRPEGRVWVIAEEHLPAIASRNGWTIDLRDGGDNSELLEAAAAELEAAEPGDGPLLVEARDPRADRPDGEDTATGAMLPVGKTSPEPSDVGTETSTGTDVIETTTTAASADEAVPADGIDLALLDRLLTSHEARVTAEVKEQEVRHALAALNEAHNRVTGELDIERRERMATADRYREERRARAVADAKLAEMRDRVVREMALIDSEKEAKTEALNRSMQAERDAANAVALLGWRARRRYRKLSAPTD